MISKTNGLDLGLTRRQLATSKLGFPASQRLPAAWRDCQGFKAGQGIVDMILWRGGSYRHLLSSL